MSACVFCAGSHIMALLILLKKSQVRISFCWIYGNQTGKNAELFMKWKKNQLGWG